MNKTSCTLRASPYRDVTILSLLPDDHASPLTTFVFRHPTARESLYSPLCLLTPLWFPGYFVLDASAANLIPKIVFRLRFPFKVGTGVFPLATSQSSTPYSHRLPSLKYNARLSSSLDQTPVSNVALDLRNRHCFSSHLGSFSFLCLPMARKVGGVEVK